jgi:hypothetical protein
MSARVKAISQQATTKIHRRSRRRSHQARLLFQALLDVAPEDSYGFKLVHGSGVSAGSGYAILRGFEKEGLVESRWEDLDPAEEGRPARRYYHLNAEGRRVAQRETAQDRRALRMLMPGWAR